MVIKIALLFQLIVLFSPVASFALTENIQSSNNNIAVIGCGVLGTSVCKHLLNSSYFDSYSITAVTKTKNNHENIIKNIGKSSNSFRLVTVEDISSDEKFTNVIFCAPPSGFDDYPSAIQDTLDNIWADGGDNGKFIFTSSGGIYGPGNGEVVSETSNLPDPKLASPRSIRLMKAEENVLAKKGLVLRLAGLYTLDRGAHNYWLERGDGTIKGCKDGIINLLHYDDAAGACVAAIMANLDNTERRIFLISDGSPTTRGGICESALKSKRYKDCKIPTFDDENLGGKGKVYDGKWSNDVLNWSPSYESFDKYMEAN